MAATQLRHHQGTTSGPHITRLQFLLNTCHQLLPPNLPRVQATSSVTSSSLPPQPQSYGAANLQQHWIWIPLPLPTALWHTSDCSWTTTTSALSILLLPSDWGWAATTGTTPLWSPETTAFQSNPIPTTKAAAIRAFRSCSYCTPPWTLTGNGPHTSCQKRSSTTHQLFTTEEC